MTMSSCLITQGFQQTTLLYSFADQAVHHVTPFSPCDVWSNQNNLLRKQQETYKQAVKLPTGFSWFINITFFICLFIIIKLGLIEYWRWADAQQHPHLQATTIHPEIEYKKQTIFTIIGIFTFTHKNNKTQRNPHFTDSPPRFINEMEKLSKNMIYRSLYRTKQTNVHKTVFTHQTNALKYVCHKTPP